MSHAHPLPEAAASRASLLPSNGFDHSQSGETRDIDQDLHEDGGEARDEVERHLASWTQGDCTALARLMPLVLADLRRLAQIYMARESPGHLLQPMALVNEAYLKLAQRRSVRLESRSQFFSVFAQTMRQILVDSARCRRAVRHGAEFSHVPLEKNMGIGVCVDSAHAALRRALRDLSAVDPRRHHAIQLSYFGGLTLQETSHALGVSVMTVRRDLEAARSWLRRALCCEAPFSCRSKINSPEMNRFTSEYRVLG